MTTLSQAKTYARTRGCDITEAYSESAHGKFRIDVSDRPALPPDVYEAYPGEIEDGDAYYSDDVEGAVEMVDLIVRLRLLTRKERNDHRLLQERVDVLEQAIWILIEKYESDARRDNVSQNH